MPINDVAPATSRVYSTASGGNYENRELPFSPGDVVFNDGKYYRFVKNADAVAITAGMLVTFTSDDDLINVSADRSGGTATLTRPAGLALSTIAEDSYGWIQCTGPSEQAIVTDGGVAAEDEIIAHATTDGGADSANYAAAADPSTSPHAVFGHALDADTSTALAAGLLLLTCPTMRPAALIA